MGNQEFKAAELLTDTLQRYGYEVETGVAGLKTAFVAERRGKGKGPTVAIIAEYDALPEIGHGCGHNIMASSAVGAAIGMLPVIDALGGSIKIIGTPAEDSTSEKVRMIREGVFDKVDFAMQNHANDRTRTGMRFKALCKTDFEFHGVSSHAARAPEKGISALDAVILTSTAIEYLKEHVKKDVSIASIITNGGGAANSIPKFASSLYITRANDKNYLDEVVKRVYNCAKGAALATGAKVRIKERVHIDSMLCIPAFDQALMQNALLLDPPQVAEQESMASTDFTNVSTRLPAARLDIAFVPLGVSTHTQDFTYAGKPESAYRAIRISSFAMAATAFDLLRDPELAARVKKEHGELQTV